MVKTKLATDECNSITEAEVCGRELASRTAMVRGLEEQHMT